jgi:polysaccharide biosynthesis protein PslF
MLQQMSSFSSGRNRVAYLSTYPPRECGIATFTKDLIDATDELNEFEPTVIAVNKTNVIHAYDRRVNLEINRDSIDDYAQAARYINSSNIQLVNIQHEFGLFGGDYGEYIINFLETIKKPVVTTLHTVHPDFNQKALEVLKCISDKSASIVVIAHAAIKILKKQGISCKNCVVIPHGCPKIDLVDNEPIKASLGLKNRLVASTFGLISSGKGIEYAIRALPYVIKKEPRIVYLIIGQTHPEVRKNEGEKYRNELMKLVNELHLKDHVRFDNRFLSKGELIRYLQATDIYLTPYISPNQISSGALTYAIGAGKPAVSTPYFHAQEMLANNRGVLCKFNDPASLANGITKLLDEKLRKTIQRRVYRYSRRFLWSNVARTYSDLFKNLIENYGWIQTGLPADKT